jgi:iron complex transport system ATP-binding protein
VIELARVSVAFGGVRVVEDASFTVPRGAFTGLVGPNGSGKTTLLRLVARLLTPAAGTIFLAGRDVLSYSRRELARRVAGVWQTPALSFGFMARQIVLLGRTPHIPAMGWESAHDLAVADAALEKTGTAHLADRVAATLSAGELQRVFIAAALAQESEVLLLDEPTSFLDLCQAARLSALLARLTAAGVTILCASHDLALLRRHASAVVLLAEGRAHPAESAREALSRQNLVRTFGIAEEEWYADRA